LNLTNNTFKYTPYKSANRITGKIIAYSGNPAIDDMERDGSNNPYQYKSKIWIKELVNVGNSDMSIYIDSPDYARLFTNKQIRKAYKNDVYVDVPNDIAYLPLFIDSFYVDDTNYVTKCNLPSEVWWSESMQRILVVNNHSTNNLNIQTTAQTQFTSDIILSPKTASLFVCDKDKWYKV
jgi:hypothetical protein